MADQHTAPSSHHHFPPYAVFHNSSAAAFMNQEGPDFGFGELEEAIVLQSVNKQLGNDEPKTTHFSSGRPAATLEMFPSWPIRLGGSSKSGGESTDSGSANLNSHTSKTETEMENDALRATEQSPANPLHEKRKGGGSERQLDAKTLRRLAQNREAARKSRLRKKAYIQQLESSRIKLSQLEQDLHRARSQGILLGASGGVSGGNITSGAAIFDMEYARWVDDDHRLTAELRSGLHGHVPDGELRVVVDSYICHYDEIFQLKGVAAKSDVFHLITGMWMTPAERCFLWIGGFRPSKLIEMLMPQLDTLTEQQAVGICKLQQSSHETEDALYQGLEQLHHSLIITIAGGGVVDGVNQMAVAAGKLSNLEGFIRQADLLRQQTLHHLRRILTVRQAARCFLAIGEYYGRLRALSSLWVSRPRESCMNEDESCSYQTQTTTELQMIQTSHNINHFQTF